VLATATGSAVLGGLAVRRFRFGRNASGADTRSDSGFFRVRRFLLGMVLKEE